ncbi:probable WRKY transcription factor 27 [Lycium barbarum]|uniref:probable WRKY transcription factor 27 n=1 Tax=Lycium barbarum TaxID=112863 RepID=UPI00293E5AB0|nr:probable WRKY transcription factor 27 [Lycium barbarum]
MDDNNWDLGAVVRSCNINRPNNVIVPSIGIESMPFENDDDWKLFDGLLDDNCDDISFKGSVEMFSRNFPVAQRQKPNDQSSSIIHPTNPLPIQLISQPIILPPPPPAEQHAPTVTTQQLINRQQQLVERALLHPTLTMPSRTSLIQTRRRKNQLIKIIYELRQEELLDDTWAWRKYGQKPIKTSPFPRFVRFNMFFMS